MNCASASAFHPLSHPLFFSFYVFFLLLLLSLSLSLSPRFSIVVRYCSSVGIPAMEKKSRFLLVASPRTSRKIRIRWLIAQTCSSRGNWFLQLLSLFYPPVSLLKNFGKTNRARFRGHLFLPVFLFRDPLVRIYGEFLHIRRDGNATSLLSTGIILLAKWVSFVHEFSTSSL